MRAHYVYISTLQTDNYTMSLLRPHLSIYESMMIYIQYKSILQYTYIFLSVYLLICFACFVFYLIIYMYL